MGSRALFDGVLGAPDREVRGVFADLSRRRGPWGQERSARRRSRGRTVLDAGVAAATRTPGGGGGGRGWWLARRASCSWIGPPPLSCTRVGIAGCDCAEVRLSLRSPPRCGGIERPGILSAMAVGWRVWEVPSGPGADRRDTRIGLVISCGHLRPNEPGELPGDCGCDGVLRFFACGEVPPPGTQPLLGFP